MITAEEARAIANQNKDKELKAILEIIKNQANSGKFIVHMNIPFSKWEKDLTKLGFEVTFANSFAIQRENYYGSIKW